MECAQLRAQREGDFLMKTNTSQKTIIIVLAVLLVLALIFGGIQLKRSSSLNTQLGNITETLDSRNADLAAASSELESVRAALAELSEAQPDEELAEALRAKEAELEAAKAELEAVIAEREELVTQQQAHTDAQSSKDAELEAVKAELEATIAEREALAAQQQAQTDAQNTKDAELEAVKAELEAAIAEREALAAQQQAHTDAQNTKDAELESAKAALAAVETELEAVKAELAELSTKQQETVDALRAKESELEATVAALTEMTARQQDTADALAETKTTLTETEAALAEARAVHHHVWGEWVTDIEPGCESEGREIRRCETEPSDEETRLIPALGHDWVPATFTQPKKCARCGETSGDPSPETAFPTMEDVRFLSRNSAVKRVSNTDETPLQLPAESSYLSEPYRARLSNNIYLMPIPELGHGHLGIVNEGTDVAVVAKRNGYVFFVTYDGRMGWNGAPLVG